jgi:hypothetical protein
MRAVARKLDNATQFCGSAMVNVPTGGRKKKLKTNVASIEASAASRNPHALAITRIVSRYAKPTVLALTGTTLEPRRVTAPTPHSEIITRTGRC